MSKESNANSEVNEQSFAEKRFMLSRRDLLEHEETLCRDLANFLEFESHALYFPVQDELKEYVYIAEERKLLLPLRHQNFLLGILLLQGAELQENTAKMLGAVTELCLEKIRLLKKERLDEKSGLMRPQFFMDRLKKEVLAINSYFHSAMQHDTQKQEDEFPLAGIALPALPFGQDEGREEFYAPLSRQSSVGLMVLPVLGLNVLRSVLGWHAAETCYGILAEKIKASIPADACCTLLDGENFAVLFPGASRKMMDNLAHDCLAISETVPVDTYKKPFLKEKAVRLGLCAGYALFPQDWDGTADSRDVEEVPHLLVHKAKITAKRLQEGREKGSMAGMQSLSYKQILQQGGIVTEVKPYSRLEVDLGRESGALEGMCFAVGSQDVRKAEIVLRKVYKNHAEAEIVLLHDPIASVQAGDRLFYAAESSFADMEVDRKTVCRAYRDFVNAVNEDIAKEENPKFALALLLLHWNGRPFAEQAEENSFGEKEEHAMKTVLSAFVQYLQKNGRKKGIYAEIPQFGTMSFNSILVYHKNSSAEELQALYKDALQHLEKKFGLSGAAGLCSYPFLNYSPAEMWEGVRKALNYALLLPAPHVGILDSLAINISADRKFSLGDTFGAVEEYRMALLADTDNILAWNSLGVCLADLGRHAEAKNAFEVAYSKNSRDFSTCYNLGTTCLALEDKKAAKEFFLASLALKPDHVYARIRLGEIAEKEKNFAEAREQYELAVQADSQSSVPYRCLAKLCIQQEKYDKAREYLQTALQKNSEDAVSLQLLAGLYLDSKEDAALAEMLARQSIALLPMRRSAWAELARALDVQGKISEAAEIRRNSMRLQ